MKKTLVTSSALLCVVTAFADAPKLDIRVIDTVQVMQQSEEGKKIVQEFEQERQAVAKGLETEQQKLMKEVQDYETRKATLTETASRKQRGDLEEKDATFKRRVANAEAELREKMQERTEAISRSVEASIKQVAAERGADLVLDVMTGRVLHAKDGLNLTGQTVAKMDASKKTEGSVKMASAGNAKAKPAA